MQPLNEKKPTVKAIADTTHPLTDGSLPIKLRVTYLRERRYWTINGPDGQPLMIGSVNDFELMMNPPKQTKLSKKTRELQEHIRAVETGARKIVESIDYFTFEAFKDRFTGRIKVSDDNLLTALENRKNELIDDGCISTATCYNCTLQSIKKFHTKKTLRFLDVTPSWLKDYEKWMLSQGNSPTTISMYLRNVRTLYNQEINQDRIPAAFYPFSKDKYTVPSSRNIKKALTLDQVRLIAAFEPKNDTESFYRDLWYFSYLANGMNPKDICNLKNKDISDQIITFTRAKTKKSQVSKIILVPITAPLEVILQKWRNKDRSPEQFVFPILTHKHTPIQEYKRIQQVVKMINHYAGSIAEKVGIEAHVTSYVARHSHATVLKRSGANSEFIKESLGHSNVKTTENYLDDFELEEKLKWANALI